MAWHHVKDETTTSRTKTGTPTTSTHSVWRCGLCRAMSVTTVGARPYGDCGKCGAKG